MAKIITSKPEVLWNLKCTLGEGTLWVKEHNSIYFTDIKKKRIHILNLKNKKKETIKVNKEIGFLAHIKNNIFILGLQGELRIVNLKSKKKIKSIAIEKSLKMNRINDGKQILMENSGLEQWITLKEIFQVLGSLELPLLFLK